ncbi:MAG: ATP-binding protein [Myxococcota bacterium]
MHPYVVVPILACTLTAATAVAVWTREPGNRRIWPIAMVSALASVWAFCEIGWQLAPDAESALTWMRASALGWVPIGPVALQALMVARDRDTPLVRSAIRVNYAVAALLLGVAFVSPWMIQDAVRTWWGWTAVPGPLMVLMFVMSGGSVAAGLLLGWIRLLAPEQERVRAVRVAIGVPLVVASLTDVVLPMLGVHVIPRLGTFSLSVIGAVHIWSFVRYGESILVPEGLTTRLLRTLPDGMASLTLEGRIRATNDRLAALLEAGPGDLTGEPIEKFLSIGRLDPARVLRDVECRLLPEAGTPVDVSLSTLLHRDRRGGPSELVLVVRDLREVVALRSRLLTSGRMAAVGELAAGIAHELNNPIAYVRANLSVLREHMQTMCKELGPGPLSPELAPVLAEAEEIVDESLEGLDRAATIVSDVREFSHAGGDMRRREDLADLVEQSIRVARLQLPSGAEVERSLAGLPPVTCEPQRIKQVFLNLLVNAAQAVEEGGRIHVSGGPSDEGVELVFADDGCGIPRAHLERIFDPFFTTKPVGVGTGLGLAIAYRIVEEHGGRITAEPGVEAGTRVRLWLPHGEEES